MKIEERIDKLNEKLQEPRFLNMKGLGNEVPFYIFDYPAEKELLIRETVIKLKDSFLKKDIKILEINLYELVLEVLFEGIPAQKVVEYEREDKHILTDLVFPNNKIKQEPSFELNGFSNGWIVDSSDTGTEKTFLLEYNNQNDFYKAAGVSLLTLLIISGFYIYKYAKIKN